MAKVRRGILGSIAEMVLYLEASPKGFAVYGFDKLGRKVVLVRRKELEPCLPDAADVAQLLSNFRKKTVQLHIGSDRVEEFQPGNEELEEPKGAS